jgi:ASPM-SPD-2-Hydin domain-containing protein
VSADQPHEHRLLRSIAASGEYAAAPGGGTPCGASVAAKGKCTFNVTFTPVSTGAIKGVVTVAHNAANSPQAFPLTGTGL